jgi:hypothetical protein
MATVTRWRAMKRVIASIISNINMCITMIIDINAHNCLDPDRGAREADGKFKMHSLF